MQFHLGYVTETIWNHNFYLPLVCHLTSDLKVFIVYTRRSIIIQMLIVKGTQIGPLLLLVCPCYRESLIATCKIVSFLCSLDNLLQKNVIVFFFGNQISKWRSFEKRAIFDLLFTFFSHQGKVTKIPSAHISLTYIHVFCSPY